MRQVPIEASLLTWLASAALAWSVSGAAFAGDWDLADPGAANPVNLFFTDPQHGIVLASTSAGGQSVEPIRRTEDGGENWTGARADTDLADCQLSGLWFSDDKVGWIGAMCGSGAANKPRLLKTEDGGTTWKGQPLPPSVTNLYRLWFARDGQHGWLFSYGGNSLWKTADGGKTWQTVPLGAANSAHPCFHAFSFDHLALAGSGGTIWMTRDAGATWQTIETHLTGDTAMLMAIHFAPDGNHGWAVGGEGKRLVNGGWAQPEKPVVLHTTDGGLHWERQNLPEMKTPLTDVWAVSDKEAWISSFWGYALPNWLPARLFHTTDAGRTWKDETPSHMSIRKLFFLDAAHGWAVGGQGGSGVEASRVILIYHN